MRSEQFRVTRGETDKFPCLSVPRHSGLAVPRFSRVLSCAHCESVAWRSLLQAFIVFSAHYCPACEAQPNIPMSAGFPSVGYGGSRAVSNMPRLNVAAAPSYSGYSSPRVPQTTREQTDVLLVSCWRCMCASCGRFAEFAALSR